MNFSYKTLSLLLISLILLPIKAGVYQVIKMDSTNGQEVTFYLCDHTLDHPKQLAVIEKTFKERTSPLTILTESARLYEEKLDALWVCEQRLSSPSFFEYDKENEYIRQEASDGLREYIFQAMPLTLARHISIFSSNRELISIDPRGPLLFHDTSVPETRTQLAQKLFEHFMKVRESINLDLIENKVICRRLHYWHRQLKNALLDLEGELLDSQEKSIAYILDEFSGRISILRCPDAKILYRITKHKAPKSIAVFVGGDHARYVIDILQESGEYNVTYDSENQIADVTSAPESPYEVVTTLLNPDRMNSIIEQSLMDPDGEDTHDFRSLDPLGLAEHAFATNAIDEGIAHCLKAMKDDTTRNVAIELLWNEGVLEAGSTKAALIVAKTHGEDGNYQLAVTRYEYAYALGAHQEAIDGIRSMGGAYMPGAYVLARMIMSLPQKSA